ncbi:hypothetical protein ACIOEW_36130 [Streptomyces sp. NPDC087901]|uniref:hypothetical protein n=1 Tax=Streptomyces sp. NPDC087901 TaxID=3365818 RepID=UPI0038052C29
MNSEMLIASSRRWMSAGLEAFTRGSDLDFAVHHFGVATEHALKAFLSSYHPALVVDANDLAGLLHATGHGALTSTPMAGSKTIQATAAFERCNQLLKPPIPVKMDVLKSLLNARNGVSHLGAHEPDEVRKHLITSIRVIDPLLVSLGVTHSDFWGLYRDLHDELLQKRADELKLAYMAKIVNAKNVLASRLGPAWDVRDLARLTAELAWIDSDEESAPCPACNMEGRLWGNTSVDRQDDGDPTDYNTGDWAVMLYPLGFSCPVCQLDLEIDEFELAGLPTEVRTSHDPVEWSMPDEDMGRDR